MQVVRAPLPSVMMIMLCNRCTLGGTEKSYARIFEMLVADGNTHHRLVINRQLLNLLQPAGILLQHDAYLTILDPPSSQHPVLCRRPQLGIIIDTLWYTWQCWRLMWRYKPAIVHPLLTAVYFCLPSLYLGIRTRFVLSAYSYQFESYRDKRLFGITIGATLKRWFMQRCAAIDALSGPIRDDLIMRGIGQDKIHVAPCSFTDLSLCQPALVREKAVVFLARFVAIKNPLLLVQAIPAILQAHPEVRFYFLGEGALEGEIRRQLEALDVHAHVVVRFDLNPTQVLNRSSVFVSLQEGENYPSQSLLEAMACGNAVVATDVGETWRLVDEQNGKRVALKADAIASAVTALLDDSQLAERQSASRQRVLAGHAPERVLEHIKRVYSQAAVGKEGQCQSKSFTSLLV